MNATIDSNPKLPNFITLLLIIALGISLAKLMWLIITPSQQLSLTSQNNKVASVNKKTVTNYGKLIADQHIFGEVPVKSTIKKPKANTKVAEPVKPKVKLNAKLFGILAYKSQEGGYALISNKGGPQKAYGKGDSLQEGVTIENILPTKVIVDNHGVKEELILPVKQVGKVSKRSTSSIPLPGSEPSFNKSLPTGFAALSGGNGNAPDLSQLKQDVLANPNKLTDIVRPSPAVINGQFKGFRIRSGKNRQLFKQLNFQNNDIITEVNGIILDSPNKGIEVFGQLESATSLSIKVLRGNQEIYIDHSF